MARERGGMEDIEGKKEKAAGVWRRCGLTASVFRYRGLTRRGRWNGGCDATTQPPSRLVFVSVCFATRQKGKWGAAF